jgi:hypothetical protein
MIIFVVSVALLTLCNLATFLLSLPSNLMAEKRDARRESSATNKTILLTVGDSSVEQKNAPIVTNVMQHDDRLCYDIEVRFTIEHFPLHQSMILTTSFFFCSRQ